MSEMTIFQGIRARTLRVSYNGMQNEHLMQLFKRFKISTDIDFLANRALFKMSHRLLCILSGKNLRLQINMNSY